MFKRAKEYLKFGAGRPPGTMWAMEKAYFEYRRKYPGKEEYAYLRLALQSRYPHKQGDELGRLMSGCCSLDDVIIKAIAVDFGYAVADRIRMDVLWNLPACSLCNKYRALSTTDNLCYGCRKFRDFSACTNCHLYWDSPLDYCQRCGGTLWRITDGPGVPMDPLSDHSDSFPERTGPPVVPSQVTPKQVSDEPDESERTLEEEEPQCGYCLTCDEHWEPGTTKCGNCGRELAFQEADDSKLFRLLDIIGPLNERCARAYEAGSSQQREYRRLRREDPQAAQRYVMEQRAAADAQKEEDQDLVRDIDYFLDSLCSYYIGTSNDRREFVRDLVGQHKRLLGNLSGYIHRKARQLESDHRLIMLSLGLAAISINDDRDTRNYDYTVASLYEAAVKAGIDPLPYFKMMADMSSSHGANSTRDYLLKFNNSGQFKLSRSAASSNTADEEKNLKDMAKLKFCLEHLIGGVGREAALELFLSACNKWNTLFITEEWIAPRLAQLRQFLSDPITIEQGSALKDVLLKYSKLDYLIEWLKDRRTPWNDFDQKIKSLALETQQLKEENERKEYERKYQESEKAWRSKGRTPEEAARNDRELQDRHSQAEAKRKYLSQAKCCPKCSAAPEKLAWFYYVSPLPPYEQKRIFHGFAGWITACDNCSAEVEFFEETRSYF